MFFAKYILKDRILKLNGLNKNIKPEQEDIEVEKVDIILIYMI